MKKTIVQILKVLLFLSLGVVLLYLAFRGIALDELSHTLIDANFWWIGFSVFFGGLTYFFRARRWMLLVHPLNYRPSFWNTYHAVMIGYLSNYALPRLGEVTRCVTLGRREKIPVDSLIGTVIIERITDLAMLFLIMLILLISWLEKFGAFFSLQVFRPLMDKVSDIFGGTWQFWAMIFGGLILVAVILYLIRKELAKFVLFRKLKDFFYGIMDGLKTVYRMERKWEYILHSLIIWFLYIMMTWMVVFSLEETSNLTFVDGMFLLVIGGLGMAAPVTAGFGAFHWIISRGLMVVYGFQLEIGGAFAILAHESNSLLIILMGAITYVLLLLSRRGKTS